MTPFRDGQREDTPQRRSQNVRSLPPTWEKTPRHPGSPAPITPASLWRPARTRTGPCMSVAMTLPSVRPRLPSSRSCWPGWNPHEDGHLLSSLLLAPCDLSQELRPHTRPGHQARRHPMCLVPSHARHLSACLLGLLSALKSGFSGADKGFFLWPHTSF